MLSQKATTLSRTQRRLDVAGRPSEVQQHRSTFPLKAFTQNAWNREETTSGIGASGAAVGAPSGHTTGLWRSAVLDARDVVQDAQPLGISWDQERFKNVSSLRFCITSSSMAFLLGHHRTASSPVTLLFQSDHVLGCHQFIQQLHDVFRQPALPSRSAACSSGPGCLKCCEIPLVT